MGFSVGSYHGRKARDEGKLSTRRVELRGASSTDRWLLVTRNGKDRNFIYSIDRHIARVANDDEIVGVIGGPDLRR